MHFRPYEPLDGMSTKKWMEINPIELPIELIIPSQGYIYEEALLKESSFCGDEFIHVVYYKGGFWCSDGHHRIHKAKLNGNETIMARLKFKI